MPSLAEWRKHLYGTRPDLRLRAAGDLLKYNVALDLPDLLFIFENFSDLGLGAAAERALLRRAGAELVAPMIQWLSSPERDMRETACRVLGASGDFSATPHLLNALRDPVLMVRRAAGFALATLGDASAVPSLRKAAAAAVDDDTNVQAAISCALRELTKSA